MLLDACNEALFSYDSKTDGIKRRQLYDDIEFMQSEAGWGVDLIVGRDGREATYRYSDPKFSINNKGLSETESGQMKEALMILTRFRGMPQFEWVNEVVAKFESSFGLKKGSDKIIGFDENKDYTAVEHISELFDAIFNENTLKVTYKDFKSPNEYEVTIHPYYLKQYNNRWFCFALDHEKRVIRNLALDRIVKIKVLKLKYIKSTIDFDEYFDDVVGVTVNENSKLETIVMKVNKKHWPYIESKPLHGSQKKKTEEKEFVTISVEVKPNYELESLILSHGENLEIVSPASFRNKIINRVKAIR
jgi:predicted DNA-binding transcriptional regulator YafY